MEKDEEEKTIQAKLVDGAVVQQEDGNKEDEEDKTLQAKTDHGYVQEASPSAEVAIQSLQGRGQPLPRSLRTFYEPRFGHDFSKVRVHHDGEAAESAGAVNARAFTVGSDVVFGPGQYAPETNQGRRLLAHELTHVVQQNVSSSSGAIRRQPIAGGPLVPPGDCTQAEHRVLQDMVDQSCKKERRCTQNDSCPILWQRIQDNAECIKARSTINAKCFRGGDPGHIEAVMAALGALGRCWVVYNRKCQPISPPVPVPVPEPVEEPKPVVDKSFMDRMAEITGLTGAALVIYIIISEGSRLFPPRNLVPVP